MLDRLAKIDLNLLREQVFALMDAVGRCRHNPVDALDLPSAHAAVAEMHRAMDALTEALAAKLKEVRREDS